jgi:DNA-binding response OmpR family regulator
LDSVKKVLVVENDEVVLVLLSHILTRQSYVVTTTSDGFEADRLLQAGPYDAILLDLKMPNGGVELIRKIASRDPDMLKRVIVVTGAILEAQALAGLPLHATVRKPFEVDSLVETVRTCVNG